MVLTLPVVFTFLCLCGADTRPPSAQSPAPQQDEALTARRQALHEAGRGAPLTLHPVRLLGQPSPRVAEALALVLENHGMSDLEFAAAPFEVAKDTAWDAVPALFSAHVGKSPVPAPARHHLYAEFLGAPKSGPDEVRWILVDAQGALVWQDVQRKGDADFRKTAQKDPDPLGCAALVGTRLFRLAEWQKAPGSIKDGKIAKLWRENSGVPDARELAAMKARAAALRDAPDSVRIVVLPTLAQGQHDVDSSARIAALLGKELGRPAVAGAADAKLPFGKDSNEQKRLWDLARNLRAALGKTPLDADYAFVVDLGLDPASGRGYVHAVVCTGKGDYVVAAFANDQHTVYQEIAPKTVADAERVAVALLRQHLR
jgi:hypothetical protein